MDANHKIKRPFINTVFISPGEARLRAGWRLLIQSLIMLIIATAGGLAFIFFPQILQNATAGVLANGILETLMITISVILARIWLDHRPFSSLGFSFNRQSVLDVLVGFAIPMILMAIIFGVESGAGWLSFHNFAWQDLSIGVVIGELALLFIVYIGVAWNEELLSRGYHLQTVASGSNLFWGVLLSSMVFGLLHLANPNSENKIMVTLGILGAGLFLAYGFLRTGQLWLSMGLHLGWNFFEGPIFGFPVSGTGGFYLTRISVNGPQLWTGAGFGPEAGLIVFPVLMIGAGLIYLYTRRRNHLSKIT